MGITAVAIIYSRWGKQSGAHMNPAVTLAFLRLGKVAPWDAVFYISAQFLGGVLGMLPAAWICGDALADPKVNYVATLPGAAGVAGAFLGEVLISLILLMVVLRVSSSKQLARFTGLFAGLCVSVFITLEAPVSGMSMNPARTFASAFLPQLWTSLWIYFVAPPIGMLLAVSLHMRLNRPVACAKLHHQNAHRCIFCEYQHVKQTVEGNHNPSSAKSRPQGGTVCL